MANWLLAAGLAALAGISSVIGGLFALRRGAGNQEHMPHNLAAVAGFLLAAAFLDLIPETAEVSSTALMYVFAGYLIVYLAESLFPAHAHSSDNSSHEHVHDHHHHLDPRAAIAALIGLAVHSYFDGVALAAGSLASTGTGLLLLVAISIHQLPVGFGLAAIMQAAGYTRMNALAATAVLFATTAIGGLTAAIISVANPGIEVFTLAFSAGTFIYIGATDMIPATHAGGSRYSVLYSLAGAAVFVATSAILRACGLD